MADMMPLETERAMGTSGLLGDGAFAALIERRDNDRAAKIAADIAREERKAAKLAAE